MNSFSEIWNNPKERTDLIIALVVCLLFGIAILSFLPTDATYLTETNTATQLQSEEKSTVSTLILSPTSTEEIKVAHTQKILTDKDVESKPKGFFQKNTTPKTIDSEATSGGVIKGESKSITNSQQDIEAKNQKVVATDTNKSKSTNTNEIEKTLDSLSIADFQELEEEKSITTQDSLDSSLEEKDAETLEETTAIDSNATHEDNKEELEENLENTKNTTTENERVEGISATNTETSKKETETTDNKRNTSNIDNPKTPSTSTANTSNISASNCIIVVGAFEKDHNAQKIIRQLKRKKYAVKTGWRKGLKYVGVPVDCQDKTNLERTLQELRKAFDIEAWLLK